MTRELVWYGDLDYTFPTPEEYRYTLMRQLMCTDETVSTLDLEHSLDIQTYIPMITYDYKLAFCQVTKDLPTLCQERIWDILIKPVCPPAPVKKPRTKRIYSKRIVSKLSYE